MSEATEPADPEECEAPCVPATQGETAGDSTPTWRLTLSRTDLWLMLLLTLFAFGVRAWHLDFPPNDYFDEKYYMKAANDYLDGRQDSNTVHPPMAKLQIAAGKLFFDGLKGWGVIDLSDCIGWRLSALLAGTAAIPLTYLLGMVLSGGRTPVGFVAALLMATDFLSLSMSRICMLDPFLSLWILVGTLYAARYCFEDPRLDFATFSALAFAVATACKWSALVAAFGAVVCMLELQSVGPRAGQGKRLLIPLVFAVAIAVIYVGAYIPFFIKEKSVGRAAWTRAAGYHQTMVRFRYNKEKFKHQYLSQFYMWPLVMRPMWYYYKEKGTGAAKQVNGIAALGSPLFWWVAAFFLLEATVLALRHHPVASFLILNYLCNWAFWAASTPGGFFYYMLPLIPLMAVTVALCLESWAHTRWGRRLRAAYLVAVVAGFILYYPLLTGMTVPERYFRALFFIKEWI